VTTTMCRILCVACCGAILALAATATPARADFFDDARKTFTTDIPHFFQDDIPCAFGGQPTSHTKASCNAHGPAPVEPGCGGTIRERPLDPPPSAISPPEPLPPPPPVSPDQ
jgi:hypothetical protein